MTKAGLAGTMEMDSGVRTWLIAGMKPRIVLVGILCAAMAMAGAEEATLQGLKTEYETALATLGEQYRAAKTREEQAALLAKRPDAAATVAAMMPLIQAQAEDPAVVEYAVWVIQISQGAVPKGIVEVIGKHKESKEFPMVLLMAARQPGGPLQELVDWARKDSPQKLVQGIAAYVKAQDRSLADGEKLAELKFAMENAGDYQLGNKTLREAAAGALYEMEHLGIGMLAGEIEGEDQDGVRFKLSDYMGKVVVLDFWGDW